MLAEAITFLFFSSVGKSLSIRETSHSPWASLSLSVCHVFKVLKSHNDHLNTVKVYQYSKFCNFTHKHSNFKFVHSKDIDTLTGDGSAVGHCTVGQPLGCSGSLNPPPRSSPLTCIQYQYYTYASAESLLFVHTSLNQTKYHKWQMQMLRLPSSIDEWAKIIRDNWDQ